MGAPPFPEGVDENRIHLLEMRVKEDTRQPGLEDEYEWYYTDTGEVVPDDPSDEDEDPMPNGNALLGDEEPSDDENLLGRFDTNVVGAKYHMGVPAAEDRQIVFHREPDNSHDRNAIAVCLDDGGKVGYLPRFEAEHLAPLLDGELIAISGKTGRSTDREKVPLSLAVRKTAKTSEILMPDSGDDWRAIFHNLFADIWPRWKTYSSATLTALGEQFKYQRDRPPLYSKTWLLHRIIKAGIAGVKAREMKLFRERISDSVRTMDFGRPAGCSALTVVPLNARSQIPVATNENLKAFAAALNDARFYDAVRLLPALFPYPAGAQGAAIAVHDLWYTLDWFDTPDCAQVYWYYMLLKASEHAMIPSPFQNHDTPVSDGVPPLSEREIKSRPVRKPRPIEEAIRHSVFDFLNEVEYTLLEVDEDDTHIVISVGNDYKGCAIYRGLTPMRLHLSAATNKSIDDTPDAAYLRHPWKR